MNFIVPHRGMFLHYNQHCLFWDQLYAGSNQYWKNNSNNFNNNSVLISNNFLTSMSSELKKLRNKVFLYNLWAHNLLIVLQFNLVTIYLYTISQSQHVDVLLQNWKNNLKHIYIYIVHFRLPHSCNCQHIHNFNSKFCFSLYNQFFSIGLQFLLFIVA